MISKIFSFRGTTFKISCFENYDLHPSWYSFVDEEDVRENFWNIKSGDYVLDVGAAFGSYALTALAAGASFVWSWSPQHLPGEEPEKTTLERSVRLNKWQERSEVYDTAIYSREGWLDLANGNFSDSEPAGIAPAVSQRTQPWTEDEGSDFLIKKVEPLDIWLSRENPKNIDWLKIDVEGAEVHVIEGARQLISRFKPNILVENHLFRSPAIAEEVKNIILSLSPSYREIGVVPYNSVSHSFYSVK